MKILFVAPRFHTNQYQLVKTLLQQNHEVEFHVARIGPTEDHSLLTPKRCSPSVFSSLLDKIYQEGQANYFPNPVHYWRLFRQFKPEIVIIRNPYRLFSLIAAFCSLITGAKIIFYTQDGLYRKRSFKTRLKQRLFLHFFNAAWMTPQLGKKEENTPAVKYMYYVPLPIAISHGGKCQGGGLTSKPKMLMIGKYHQERKKHLLLINAIKRLKEKYDFKVTIVGECVLENQLSRFKLIKAAVDDSGLSHIVDLKMNVPYSKMDELYASHHVFVLPSINELYGVSVVEAMGHGLPVICTDTSGARFNIKEGVNGYVVKSNSLDDLTKALEALISDKERICSMSKNSLRYAEDHLSGAVFYSNFKHLLKDRFDLLLH